MEGRRAAYSGASYANSIHFWRRILLPVCHSLPSSPYTFLLAARKTVHQVLLHALASTMKAGILTLGAAVTVLLAAPLDRRSDADCPDVVLASGIEARLFGDRPVGGYFPAPGLQTHQDPFQGHGPDVGGHQKHGGPCPVLPPHGLNHSPQELGKGHDDDHHDILEHVKHHDDDDDDDDDDRHHGKHHGKDEEEARQAP